MGKERGTVVQKEKAWGEARGRGRNANLRGLSVTDATGTVPSGNPHAGFSYSVWPCSRAQSHLSFCRWYPTSCTVTGKHGRLTWLEVLRISFLGGGSLLGWGLLTALPDLVTTLLKGLRTSP